MTITSDFFVRSSEPTTSASSIQKLPDDLLSDLFNRYVLTHLRSFPTVYSVCKRWRRIMNESHPLYLLRSKNFKSGIANKLLTSFASDFTDIQKLHRFMSAKPLWIEERMEKCTNKDSEEEQFILNQMWSTAFRTVIHSPNTAIEARLQFLREKNMFFYLPRDVQALLEAIKPKIVGIEDKKVVNSILKDLLRLYLIKYENISQTVLDEEICVFAVAQKNIRLADIPIPLRTYSVCLTALKHTTNPAGQCFQVPDNLWMDASFQLNALKLKIREVIDYMFKKIGQMHTTTTIENLIALVAEAVKHDGCILEPMEKLLYMGQSWQRHLNQVQFIMPNELQPANIYTTAVKNTYVALQYVPKQFREEALKVVPDAFKEEALRIAQESDKKKKPVASWTLDKVPEKFRSKDICLAAIQANGLDLRYVPKHLKTKSLCLEALKENARAFVYLPKKFLKEEICLAGIQLEGLDLQYVPKNLRTTNVCLEAVKQDSLAFAYVPHEFMTEAFCLTTFQNKDPSQLPDPSSPLQYIPVAKMTEAICLAAVEETIEALEWMPKELKTDDFFLKAYEKNYCIVPEMPEHLLTSKMLITAAEIISLCEIPEKLITKEVVLAVIEKSPWSIESVPEEFKTESFYLTVLQKFILIRNEVFAEVNDYLILNALEKNGLFLQYLPETLKTEPHCVVAVKQNGLALEFVPDPLKTFPICQAAVEQNDQAVKYVPENLKENFSAHVNKKIKLT